MDTVAQQMQNAAMLERIPFPQRIALRMKYLAAREEELKGLLAQLEQQRELIVAQINANTGAQAEMEHLKSQLVGEDEYVQIGEGWADQEPEARHGQVGEVPGREHEAPFGTVRQQ